MVSVWGALKNFARGTPLFCEVCTRGGGWSGWWPGWALTGSVQVDTFFPGSPPGMVSVRGPWKNWKWVTPSAAQCA